MWNERSGRKHESSMYRAQTKHRRRTTKQNWMIFKLTLEMLFRFYFRNGSEALNIEHSSQVKSERMSESESKRSVRQRCRCKNENFLNGSYALIAVSRCRSLQSNFRILYWCNDRLNLMFLSESNWSNTKLSLLVCIARLLCCVACAIGNFGVESNYESDGFFGKLHECNLIEARRSNGRRNSRIQLKKINFLSMFK